MALAIQYADLTGAWGDAEPWLRAGLPLKSVRVTLPSTTALKTISSLHVDLTPVAPREQPPFVQILLFACEDSASYEARLKARVEEWGREQTSLQNEWLVLLTLPIRSGEDSSANDDGTLEAVRQSLRSRERAAALGDAQTEWVALLKSLVQREFLRRCRQHEDALASLDGQQSSTATSYGRYFTLKDSMACVYEAMSLPTEALRLYTEVLNVEARLQSAQAIPTSGRILLADSVAAREAVTNGAMSLESLKLYIFARKARLLFALNKPSEVLRSGLQLIRSTVELHAPDPGARSWACEACWDLIANFRNEYAGAIEHAPDAGISSARVDADEVCRASTQVCDILRFLAMRLLEVATGREDLASAHVWRTRRRDTTDHAIVWATKLPDLRSLGSFQFGGESRASSVFVDADIGGDTGWLSSNLASAEKFDTCYARVLQLLVGYCQLAGRRRSSHLVLKELIDIAWGRGDWHRALAALTAAPVLPLEWNVLRRQLIYVALCYRQLGDLNSYFRTTMYLCDSHSQSAAKDAVFERFLADINADLSPLLAHAQGQPAMSLEFAVSHLLRIEVVSLQGLRGTHDTTDTATLKATVGEITAFNIELTAGFFGHPMSINAVALLYRRVDSLEDNREPAEGERTEVQCLCKGSWSIRPRQLEQITGEVEMDLPNGLFCLSRVVFVWGGAALTVPWTGENYQVEVIEPTGDSFQFDLFCPRQSPPNSSSSIVCTLANPTSIATDCILLFEVSTGASIGKEAAIWSRRTDSAVWHPQKNITLDTHGGLKLHLDGDSTQHIVVSLLATSEAPSEIFVHAKVHRSKNEFDLLEGTSLQTARVRCAPFFAGEAHWRGLVSETNDAPSGSVARKVVAFELNPISMNSDPSFDIFLEDYNLNVPSDWFVEADPNTHLKQAVLKTIALAFRVARRSSLQEMRRCDGMTITMTLRGSPPLWSSSRRRNVPTDLKQYASLAWTQAISAPPEARPKLLFPREYSLATTTNRCRCWKVGMPRRVMYDIRGDRVYTATQLLKFRVVRLGQSWMTTTPTAGCITVHFSGTRDSLIAGDLSCVFLPLRAGELALPEVQIYDAEDCSYMVQPRGYGDANSQWGHMSTVKVKVLPATHVSGIAIAI